MHLGKDGEHTTVFPAEFLDIVTPHRWCLKRGRDTWYAMAGTKKSPEGKHSTIELPIYLYPEIPGPRDHKDGNGLNNRQENVRRGDDSLNERYRQERAYRTNQSTGICGVSRQQNRHSYRAYWSDIAGKQQRKGFLVRDYGSDEEAKVAARAYRREQAAAVIAEIEADHAEREATEAWQRGLSLFLRPILAPVRKYKRQRID